MTGLTAADLRFNIAKLVPGADGAPANWQNYVNKAKDGVVQASQERMATDGTLRERFRAAGLARATQFDWKTTAAQTLKVYAQASGHRV